MTAVEFNRKEAADLLLRTERVTPKAQNNVRWRPC